MVLHVLLDVLVLELHGVILWLQVVQLAEQWIVNLPRTPDGRLHARRLHVQHGLVVPILLLQLLDLLGVEVGILDVRLNIPRKENAIIKVPIHHILVIVLRQRA